MSTVTYKTICCGGDEQPANIAGCFVLCTATTEFVQRQQDSQALTEFGSDPRGGQNRDDGGPLAVVGGPMARRPRRTRGPSRACGIARKSLDTPLDLTRFPTIECIYTYTTRQK